MQAVIPRKIIKALGGGGGVAKKNKNNYFTVRFARYQYSTRREVVAFVDIFMLPML